jgi:hypothetical protein
VAKLIAAAAAPVAAVIRQRLDRVGDELPSQHISLPRRGTGQISPTSGFLLRTQPMQGNKQPGHDTVVGVMFQSGWPDHGAFCVRSFFTDCTKASAPKGLVSVA